MKSLKSLNDAQLEAVTYNSSPHLIVAGAGSGKTKVLTHKIAYLIENNFDPSTILALTFTNKASNEMKERIQLMIGVTKAKKLWMGTFHSILAKILRNEAERLNYRQNFSIYDNEDSVSLTSNVLQELNISIDDKSAKAIHHRISSLKNQMILNQAHLNLITRCKFTS